MVVVVITVPLVLLTRRKCAGSGVRDGGRAAERGKFCGKFLPQGTGSGKPGGTAVSPERVGGAGTIKESLNFLVC